MYSAKLFSLHCCTLAAVQCETGGLRPPLCPPGPWRGLMWASGVVSAPTEPNVRLLACGHVTSSSCTRKQFRFFPPENPDEQRVFGLAIPEHVAGQIFCIPFLLFPLYSLKRPLCTFPSSYNESLREVHVSLWDRCCGAAHNNIDSQLVHCEKFNKCKFF